nr:PREDICTED: olfactory receptor 19-like [Lepisosteus oculatus]
MSSLNSTLPPNVSLVRPQFFYINGLSNIPYVKYYYIFLCFVFTVTLLGNSFIMFIIYIEQSLHTPKYMAVFHLAAVDTCGSTALIPKMIEAFLFDFPLITYEACLANMFFVHLFQFLQSFTVVLLAYDRFVAICFPLKYHLILTTAGMGKMLGGIWILAAGVLIVGVGFITRLSFCKSIVINSYFCDHGPVYRMSCNDNFPNYVITQISIIVLLTAPLTLILSTYACIILAVLKIASLEERIKAMKTCTSHLILVAMFYLPISAIYIAANITTVDPNIRIISTSLSSTIPPMMNPIIYTIKTEEVMKVVKRLHKRNKTIKPKPLHVTQLYFSKRSPTDTKEQQPAVVASNRRPLARSGGVGEGVRDSYCNALAVPLCGPGYVWHKLQCVPELIDVTPDIGDVFSDTVGSNLSISFASGLSEWRFIFLAPPLMERWQRSWLGGLRIN